MIDCIQLILSVIPIWYFVHMNDWILAIFYFIIWLALNYLVKIKDELIKLNDRFQQGYGNDGRIF